MKKIILSIVLFSCFLSCIIVCLKLYTKNDNKKIKNGNNKSVKEIEEYLLDINSYRAIINVKIKSNKNENIYKLEQEVKENYAMQKVVEPESLSGMEMIYENGTLQIKNSNINVSKVYNNYPYIYNNVLFLSSFFYTYKSAEEKLIEEKDENIYMKFINKEKKYNKEQILIIDKQNLKPKTLEIKDNSNNSVIYILYNEIELNN